ncbi:MAG: hypothetical protein ACI8P3_003204 [Saprospiraceae bacterium]|jgi:hypothetical protein
MLKNILFSGSILLLIASCTAQSTQDTNLNQFGDPITEMGSISYGKLLETLSTTDSVNTKVTGTVSGVCKAKGCWMTIVSDETDTEMRVKFKDYGFFVPKDIEGRTVVFEGIAYKAVTSVADLRHLAEDAGKSKEEIETITEPEAGYNFLASGVLLLNK